MYLVVLQGHGDVSYFLISQSEYQWATNFNEAVPTDVIDRAIASDAAFCLRYNRTPQTRDAIEKELMGTIGSWDNDRMLSLRLISEEFSYAQEALNYAADNNMTILGEYNGDIY